MKKQCFIIGTLVLCAMKTITAQEKSKDKTVQLNEIVIDSRFKIKKENSGKVVHKITPKLIEKNKGKTVIDLINRISGIEINGNTSVFGQNLGYFVRGGVTNEVVILIDGLQVINPLQNNFDLRLLNLEQVESIEISKGASSTLYGSGATTAVIDIKLKKAKSGAVNGSVGFSTGTNSVQNSSRGNVVEGTANLNGTINNFNYNAQLSSFSANGFSAAKSENSNVIFSNDPFRKSNFDVRLGYNFSKKLIAEIFGNINDFHNSYDAGSFTDGNNKSESRNVRVGASPKYIFDNGSITANFAYSKYNIDRLQTSFPGKSNGENYIFDVFGKYQFEKIKLIGGVNFQNNAIQTFSIPFGSTELTETIFVEKPKSIIVDPYLNALYISGFGLNVNTGARVNNHNKYGSHFVYNVNPSFRWMNNNGYVKIFGSYSTAFIAPSIAQLYGAYGNLDLKPQESLTTEGGVEFKKNSFLINAVYFYRDVKNRFTFDPATFLSINGGDIKINGIEITSFYNFSKSFNANANYAYTKNDQIATRIPKHKTNIGLEYTLKSKTIFSLDYQYVSDRDDTDFRNFPSVPVALESYSLVDFSVNHALKDSIKLFFTATNLFDSDYQEAFGFNTRGRNYRVGVKFQL